MVQREDLIDWLIEALRAHNGSATILVKKRDVRKKVNNSEKGADCIIKTNKTGRSSVIHLS
jgi:hypothetical protein